MKNIPKTLLPILSALVFTVLLYERSWGLNLLLFQLFVMGGLLIVKTKSLTKPQWIATLGTLLAVITSFFYHSVYGFWFSFFSLFGMAIFLEGKTLKSFHLAPLAGFMSFFKSFPAFFNSLGKEGLKRGLPILKLKKLSFYLIPLVLIVTFSLLYGGANPTYQQFNASIGHVIERMFNSIWRYIEIPVVFFFLLGMVISIPLFYPSLMDVFKQWETKSEVLTRLRKTSHRFKKTGLKQETKVGIFLLGTLNLMLLVLLSFEVKDVWFGFDYEGQYLKEFVHSGMYLLLISIFISMGIALYFFRGNQNFFSKAKTLKWLTYIWLILNGLLVISVGIRNGWYIHYFSLAYGRIVLSFFLVASLFGVFSVFKKVNQQKNSTYLWRANGLAVYLLLVTACLFNWDVLIAQYNFKNADSAFLHLDYLIKLEDRALPYLQNSTLNLAEVEVEQQKRLNLSSSIYRQQYLSADSYQTLLNQRTDRFKENWEQKDWLEWNPAEAKAYKLLD